MSESWPITKIEYGLLVGFMLIVGPAYQPIKGELRPWFWYHFLCLNDCKILHKEKLKGEF